MVLSQLIPKVCLSPRPCICLSCWLSFLSQIFLAVCPLNVPLLQVFASLLPVSFPLSLPSDLSHFPTISASPPPQPPHPNPASVAIFPLCQCLCLSSHIWFCGYLSASSRVTVSCAVPHLSPISCWLSHLVSLRVSTSPCIFPLSSVSLISLTNATQARVRREGAVEMGWGGPVGGALPTTQSYL